MRAGDDIVAEAGGEWDRNDGLEAEFGGESPVFLGNGVKSRLIEIDQIELVDRQNHMANAEQRGDVAVAAGLGQHAAPRVDQHDGEIGGGGAGRHVARIFLVAGRVGDDELALVGREEAVGDINGDALLALGLQPVHEKREIQRLAIGAMLAAVAGERGQLVFEDQLRVVEQPADQGRLAVIDRAAGEKAQHGLVFLLAQIGGQIGFGALLWHQK